MPLPTTVCIELISISTFFLSSSRGPAGEWKFWCRSMIEIGPTIVMRIRDRLITSNENLPRILYACRRRHGRNLPIAQTAPTRIQTWCVDAYMESAIPKPQRQQHEKCSNELNEPFMTAFNGFECRLVVSNNCDRSAWTCVYFPRRKRRYEYDLSSVSID